MDKKFLKRTKEDLILDTFIIVVLTILCIITLYPLWYVVVASLSSTNELLASSGLLFWPQNFTLEAYKAVLTNDRIILGFRNTIMYVLLGTTISMFLTIHLSYALSRKWLHGRKWFMLFVVVPMFFSGGLIPTFLVIQKLGLYDTIWAIVLPSAISVWNVIMMKTYFQSLSTELEESAMIEGATDFQILWKIYVPIAKPMIAVMILFYSVAMWNSWFSASIYLRNENLAPLQLVMQEILIQGDTSSMMEGGSTEQVPQNLKYATMVVSTLPILLVYPFVQKYFVKGVMLGSVKE